jgi:type II secretory pathway pseudopilin PulG
MERHPAPGPVRTLDSEVGFTIVEVLIACVVLVVGMLGVLTLLTGALRATAGNNEHVGATNLARELGEEARGLDYDDMTTALLPVRLQQRGLGSGSPWTIARRGVTYTITATACVFDDPADKLAATPPDEVCAPQPLGSPGDRNGDDFRRATFQVSWRGADGDQSAESQTMLVINPSGGLGPRITSFTPVTQTITSNDSSVSIGWTTTTAQTLRWMVDDGASSGSTTGVTSFTTTWDIGSSGSGSEILDGSYQITAQPFDDLDVAGEAKRANVVLNRRRPYPPPSLDGGHNTLSGDWVELQWSLDGERDILGYRVVWAGPDRQVGNEDDVPVCLDAANPTILAPTTTSCIDTSPPSGATTYYVVAVDRTPTNVLRDGDRRTLQVVAATSRPKSPIGLGVVSVSGQPKLSWTAPPSESPSFYRIYRDLSASGRLLRYDRTSSNATTFTDASPANGLHWYWVTAVDSSFNESVATGPVPFFS